MLDQAVLFVVAEATLAHMLHDTSKMELSGSAPCLILRSGKDPGLKTQPNQPSRNSLK
jgi:hypothetical protein